MVVQKTLDNLKERPKDEKTAVATGISVVVVAILLIGWGFWFVSNLKRGGEFNTFIGSTQEQYLPQHLQGANEKLQDLLQPTTDSLRELRDRAVNVDVQQPLDGGTQTNENLFESPENSL